MFNGQSTLATESTSIARLILDILNLLSRLKTPRSKHSVKVTSIVVDMDYKKMYTFSLPNIKTLVEYFYKIPIEIHNHSDYECIVRRIYLQYRKGLFETIRAFLTNLHPITVITLQTMEPFPLIIKPKSIVTIHVPTHSVLDVNRVVKGNNVRIVVEHSNGISKSRSFWSGNFNNYQTAVSIELSKQFARTLLKKSTGLKCKPEAFIEEAMKKADEIGLDEISFLFDLREIAESEKRSLGLSGELINTIKVKCDKMISALGTYAQAIALTLSLASDRKYED